MIRALRPLAIATAVIVGYFGGGLLGGDFGRRADAYPQFQLSHDQTCTGCHISPAGGGLLTENGQAMAEASSQFGTNPDFMYGKLGTPDWLVLGGDFRGNSGYLQTPQRYLISFPMQADLYGHARFGAFSLQVTGGYRPPQYNNEAATRAWSREHYLMWQSDPGGTEGLYVRVGRFMPVFGLRFAEHPDYVRRFGGTPLYGETYAAAIEYVTAKYEGHVTGFVRDPLIDPVVHSNGVAGYGEFRITENAAVGAEGMIAVDHDDRHYRGGATAKYYFGGPKILLQGEFQVVNEHIGPNGLTQLVGYGLASWTLGSFLVDVGVGHYDENLRIKGLDRDALDLNFHWFTTSHFEAVLNARAEFIGQGSGGPTGSYVLLQGHYRL